MTTTKNLVDKKVFLNRRFYLSVKMWNTEKATKLIKAFGGQIDQFLEKTVTYVLTDVPRKDWPTIDSLQAQNQKERCDKDLTLARRLDVKIMSFEELINWCSKYISSQSSSDEDDESTNITHLQEPYIKFEDALCQHAPTVKELVSLPTIHFPADLRVGRSIFADSTLQVTPNQSAHNIQAHHIVPQSPNALRTASRGTSIHNINTNVTGNQQPQARRRHCIYCEICNLKIADKLEEHIQSQLHKTNVEKTNWTEVTGVIDSLPNLSTLNMRRLTSLPTKNSENQEFLCLHKVESVSQIFFSNKDFQSLSPITDRKLVPIQ